MEFKYAMGLWLFGELSDRFTVYRPSKQLQEKFTEAGKVSGANGIEVMYPTDFGDDQVNEVGHLLRKHALAPAGLLVDLFGLPKWMNGSFSSKDSQVRKDAVQLSKQAIDVAVKLDCKTITLWLGQDGYDYPFQTDYQETRRWLTEGVREVAEYRSDVNIALEYKPKEPRTHLFVGTASQAIMLCNDVGLNNVGVTLDVGHALVAGENPSESVAILNTHGKLFHIHLNDNYRSWDDDMLVASVNLCETLELMYWLRKVDYTGWLSLDIYPYREDPVGVCRRSIENLNLLSRLLDVIGIDSLDACVRKGDPVETMGVLRKIFRS